jgi:hypothetical protein
MKLSLRERIEELGRRVGLMDTANSRAMSAPRVGPAPPSHASTTGWEVSPATRAKAAPSTPPPSR